jgi:hypothetical protein
MDFADQRGTPWRIPGARAGGIEGFPSRTSVLAGQRFSLYVDTRAGHFRVRAFRMGWYGGKLGRQVWVSRRIRGHRQPGPALARPATRTMTAPWQPSVSISTRGWAPGDYLLRLEGGGGRHESFVPMTVRAGSARGRVVLISPVTTWQAYNLWGCCDLYEGGDGSFATRSRAVTFDRPYLNENGAGQFIRDELGIVARAERLHLALDYITDVDLQLYPHILRGARAVVSMGHDEYYSAPMRSRLAAARSHGTNLAFFGANAIFRRIRYGNTRVGPDRLEINYKIAAEDPLDGRDNKVVTADWPSPPDANPESSLIGAQYGCYFGLVDTPGVISAAHNWMYHAAHVYRGEQLPGLIGPEIDAIQYSDPTPRPIESIMHSPARCPGNYPADADASYYVAPSQAAVFDAGSINWACEAAPHCIDQDYRRTHAVVQHVTDNVLKAFASGPAGRSHPVRLGSAHRRGEDVQPGIARQRHVGDLLAGR